MSIFLTVAFLFSNSSWAQLGSLGELMRFEQRVNRNVDESRIVSLQNGQDAEYAPEKGKWFKVRSFWVSEDKVVTFDAKSSFAEMFSRINHGKNQVLFLVHPESEGYYAKFLEGTSSGPNFRALATASSRTVLMHPEDSPETLFFAKLSLNKKIGGTVRTIPSGEIARSIGTTRILDDSLEFLPSEFKFFPETLGIMPKEMERGGFIIREIPLEVLSGRTQLVPMFSLYTPQKSGSSPVADMIRRSKKEAQEFVKDKIISPFVALWLDLVINHGIAIEAHGQNFLMEVKDHNLTGKFYFRDFGGFNIDLKYRRERNFPTPQLPVIKSLGKDYHQGSHEKALFGSLYNYFEGGVLYGLAQELHQINPKITYVFLRSSLRIELMRQGAAYGITWNVKDVSYSDAVAVIREARLKRASFKKVNSCRILFERAGSP